MHGELGEDRAEIDVAVAERAEAAGAVRPVGEAGIDALLRRRAELRVLDVKGLDALVIDVDEPDIVEVLQAEMRRVVVDAAALVPADLVEEALVGRAVEEILAGMQLEANVDADLVVHVEDRPPAPGELLERGLDQIGGPRRPGIEERPGERAGEGHVRVEAEIAAGPRPELDLLDRPFLALLRVAAHFRHTKRMAIDTQEMTEATAWRCLALSVRTSWSLSRKSASIRLVIFCADQLMNRAANSEKMMIRVIFRPLVENPLADAAPPEVMPALRGRKG